MIQNNATPTQVTQLPAAPHRPEDAHKGTFGRAVIVAGSAGMSGAAVLAGRAALHGGAGLVTVAVPSCVLDVVASGHPSYMTLPLAHDRHGRLDTSALEAIGNAIDDQTAIAIGPGLGRSRGVAAVVGELYESCPRPLVLDADALNALNAEPPACRFSHLRVLTPHPGEFSRLTAMDTAAIQSDRVQVAANFAKHYGLVLVLKGNRTVITDGERYAINETGNVGLATGGTGDVLTGLVSALLAQGMDVFDAAQLGAHLHGLAADCAADNLAAEYMTSVDLLPHLNTAWLRFHQTAG